MKQIRIFAWGAVVVFVAVFIYLTMMGENLPGRTNLVVSDGGGPVSKFSLTDHTGQVITSEQMRGKYQLIYFGYTFCPDACPAAMDKLSLALEMLEADGLDTNNFQPIFISVDPNRDTAEELGNFRTLYHPSLITLRGSDEVIAEIAEIFGAYYKRVGQSGDGDDYLMNHLDVIFVMGRDGAYNQIFTTRDTPVMVADKLKALL